MISAEDLIVKVLKQEYKEGDRVELIEMDDLQAPPVGTRGTVKFVDDIGQIHVSWDNGSTLALCVKDRWARIEKEENK